MRLTFSFERSYYCISIAFREHENEDGCSNPLALRAEPLLEVSTDYIVM
jgi:hypothetical protein